MPVTDRTPAKPPREHHAGYCAECGQPLEYRRSTRLRIELPGLKAARKGAGMSQWTLAKKCCVTQGHISNLERSLVMARVSVAYSIADALGVQLERLTEREGDG
jgi:DNA-binding XRE family transcriptional regulator